MPAIVRTEEFDIWLRRLRDTKARGKILVLLDRLALGNPGDVEPVGEGVSELKIHYGPGYRIYFKQSGEVANILWGGTKDTQAADIEKAKALARS